ncbi:MAG TPA: NADH-quinone oxidoreductase subunit C [Candidatus Methylacidiphilales bacterium]|jgi:NADH-quinone oxidoreductase subunit C|nr:NADH-quinone oxidoreductase subunit C [Candidatus Methylacidiphilales bacterium]
MPAADAIASLQKQFPGKVGQGKEFRDEQVVEIDREIVRAAAAHLKNELGFNLLLDITSVDHFGDEPRYEVVYEFCALGGPNNLAHLRVKLKVSEDDPSVDSIVPVFQGADWHEREIFDMMGITFAGHPDLRRILMWDGYPFHPLKKDFPLEGLPSDLPGEEGFSRRAPMEGGPYVALPTDKPPAIGDAPTTIREPRANPAEH